MVRFIICLSLHHCLFKDWGSSRLVIRTWIFGSNEGSRRNVGSAEVFVCGMCAERLKDGAMGDKCFGWQDMSLPRM